MIATLPLFLFVLQIYIIDIYNNNIRCNRGEATLITKVGPIFAKA